MVTPPYGCNAGGSQRRADVGIGPYEKERKFHQPPGPAAHSGASAPAGARKWVGIAAKIIPKGAINLGQSLSQPAADSSLCTREPWGRGMRIAASARWASSQLQWFPVIPRSGATWESVPFYDGRGFGPPRSSAPTPRGGRGNGTPGSSCPTGGRREVSSIAGAALSEAESAFSFDCSTAVFFLGRQKDYARRRVPEATAAQRRLLAGGKWGWKAIDLHRYPPPPPVGRGQSLSHGKPCQLPFHKGAFGTPAPAGCSIGWPQVFTNF